ncbi:MAG: methyltransferase domain-containing protein [Sediminibacterium sp.]
MLICISYAGNAQQKPNKRLSFCGWKYTDTSFIRSAFGKKLEFLRITNGETIVDVGSSSGAFEGSISVIGNFNKVNFVLVDIDTNCLNQQRVNNMIDYHSQVRGTPIPATFSIVQNTVDSLYLPLNTYKKVLLMNTLHEVPDKQKIVRDICAVLQKGGELILDELVARPKHTIHGGCKQPLMDEAEIKTLFEQNGFRQADTLMNPANPKKIVNPEYMVRFIKN